MNRPVKITSVALKPKDIKTLVATLNGAVRNGPDLVLLPETCLADQAEGIGLDSDEITEIRKTAATHNTNIVFPLYLAYGGVKRVNAAVVVDRGGKIAGVYRKRYPYWSEFDLSPPCAATDGGDLVVDLDFGRIGLAICFDANFPAVWQDMSDKGAELAVWCSAYSAGAQLSAYALIHHYPIVTCTMVPDCAYYDIDGREVRYGKGDDIYVMEYTADLDKCIFHENFNSDKAKELLREHGGHIELEKDYWREQWFVLRSKSKDVSARELAKKYGMKELKAYKNDSRASIDSMRIKL